MHMCSCKTFIYSVTYATMVILPDLKQTISIISRGLHLEYSNLLNDVATINSNKSIMVIVFSVIYKIQCYCMMTYFSKTETFYFY